MLYMLGLRAHWPGLVGEYSEFWGFLFQDLELDTSGFRVQRLGFRVHISV